MKQLALVLVSISLLAACGPENPRHTASAEPAAASGDSTPTKGIAWFEGTVDEAFALARETGKPLFLYWSAEWCPPCHAIKATIFSKPEFIERSNLFVPVYLDGDDENAQAYGEKFDVMGYPTMIVYDAEGEELTRIPNGFDIQAYANILDLTLTASSSARSLLEGLMNGEDALDARNCSLLAYHAWNQDPGISEDFDLREGFRRMFDACPAQLETERSILYMSWLNELQYADSEAEGSSGLTAEQRDEALGVVETILDSPALTRANIFSVVIAGPALTKLITEPGSERRAQLITRFYRTFDAVAADESIYKRERIYTLMGKIGFERIDDETAELSDELMQEIRDMVAWADESTSGVYDRQPVINALGNVLEMAGMDDVARPLLLAELEKSKQPYYFMTGLANIEQRAGDYDAAIGWLKKAHESTTGAATRFEWGQYYLFGLLEMTPEDTETIQDTAVELIVELLRDSGGFYQRPKAQLKRIEGKLLEWGADRGDAVSNIQESVRSACKVLPRRDETCEAFLESV